MPWDRGDNSGLTGLIDIDGTVFAVGVLAYDRTVGNVILPVRIRGSNYALTEDIQSVGTLICTGKVRYDLFPEPTTLRGVNGTITLRNASSHTQAIPVHVESCRIYHNEKINDAWGVEIICRITGDLTSTWTGSQNTPSELAETNGEVPDNIDGLKVRDPKGLQDTARQRMYYRTLAASETNEAENTLLETLFTSGEPVDNLKLRSVSVTRVGPKSLFVDLVWGRTDTEDDVEMPGTNYTLDQSGNVIAGEAQVTVVENDSTPDGGVTVSGLVLRYIRKQQLHDSKWAMTYIFGQNTPEDDVEFDNTVYENDVSNLTDAARVTLINSSSTYPSSLDTPPSTPTTGTLKLRRIITKKLTTAGRWQHTAIYGLTTEEDDVEMGATTYEVDQSGNVIGGSARVCILESDSTPDGGVTVSGLVLRYIEKKQQNDGKWLICYIFGQNTPEDDLEFDGTNYINDVSNLGDSAQVTLVNSSTTYPVALDTPPTTPTTATLKLREVRSRQLTTGGKWAHTGIYGLQTREDEIEQGGTEYQVDQSGNVVAGVARVTVVESDSTPDGGVSVSGLVLRFIEKKQLNDGKWAITYVFGQNTPEDDIEFDGTVYENDVSNINDSARVTLINSSTTYPVALDTPPTTPATATLKLRRVVSKKLTTSGQWQHTGIYGMRTEEDEVEQQGTVYNVDQSGNVISSEARVTVVESDSTPDGGVTVSGLVNRYIEKKQLNDGKWAITYVFGMNTPENDLEYRQTEYSSDANRGERDVVASIETISTTVDALRDAQLAAELGTATFVSLDVQQLTGSRALVRKRYEDTDKIVVDDIQTRQVTFRSLGNVVMVSEVYQKKANEYIGYVIPIDFDVAEGNIVVRRRYSITQLTNAGTQNTVMFRSALGKINVDAFLSYPERSVKYLGWQIDRSYALESTSTTHYIYVNHLFRYRSVGFWNDTQVAVNKYSTATQPISIGLNDATRFGWTIGPADLAVFGVFLS